MPCDSTPRMSPTSRASMPLPGMTVPGRREHALHAGARVGRAADDLHDSPLPVSTMQTRSLSALGCCSAVSTWATREGGERCAPGRRCLRLRGRCGSASRRSSSTSASVSRCSLSQDSVNFIAPSPPSSDGHVERREAVMLQPAQIGVEEGAQVGHAVFQHREAVDAHAEGEALVLRRDRGRRCRARLRVHHAAAEDLEPVVAFAELQFAARAVAADIDFGRRLGEREVRRAEAQRHVGDFEERACRIPRASISGGP